MGGVNDLEIEAHTYQRDAALDGAEGGQVSGELEKPWNKKKTFRNDLQLLVTIECGVQCV